MTSEARACKNCNSTFVIDPDDFEFYEQMKVPVPTWCPQCKLQQRLAFRNERHLYKRQCNAPGHTESMISMYAPESSVTVYDRDFWWSDGWDPATYQRAVDLSIPFLAQFRDLLRAVPAPSLILYNPVNSDYCNYTIDNKNCYLVFGGDFNENCSYSTFTFLCKDSMDLYWSLKCELCYEVSDSLSCYRVANGKFLKDCTDSAFLIDCSGCTNCIGCIGVSNRSYCILNEQYSKEEYESLVKDLHLEDRRARAVFAQKFYEFQKSFPHRCTQIVRSVNCTGDNIVDSKNCKNCFDASNSVEDCKDCYLLAQGARSIRGSNHAGHQAELVHNSFATFDGVRNVICSWLISGSYNISYSYNCRNSSNLFGCVGLQNKQYCILNKQYSKEEYEELVPKIIEQMKTTPYADGRGMTYAYGDFPPVEFSPFGYNETIAHELFPLSKEEAAKKGFVWRDDEKKQYDISMKCGDIPPTIAGVGDDITSAVIECAHKGLCGQNCTVAFRVTPQEIAFYKQLNLPIPDLCHNCRHYERLKLRNPMRLWERSCECAGDHAVRGGHKNFVAHVHGTNACPNIFQTSYAPDRAEVVYCEECYQTEVA